MKGMKEDERDIKKEEGGPTQDEFLKKIIKRELEELGIDISNDEYYKDKKFKMLEKEYVSEGILIPKSWWIEKNLVGQERLKKIYGIYAMGVEHEYAEEELKNTVWMEELASRYSDAKIESKEEFSRTKKDIEQYFFRKKTEKSDGAGLVERLRNVGIDVQKFNYPEAKIEKIKLFYLLYCFEFDNKVKICPFLGNPTLENVDNIIVGGKDRNGELMAHLKNNLLKEIDPDYVKEVKDIIYNIASRCEELMIRVRYIDSVDALDCINVNLKWILSIIEDPLPYEDTLLETFYLKLSLHEMFGREKDLVDVSYKYSVEEKEPEEYRVRKFEELPENGRIAIDWGNGPGQYETVYRYVKEHRRVLTQCIFGREDVHSNDYKKFDRAVEGIENFLNFLKDNTSVRHCKYIHALLIVSYLQVSIFIDKKEKIDNPFYRHTAGDIRTFNSEIWHGREALSKSQFAWKEKVMAQYDANIGKKKVRELQREVERQMDLLLLKVYQSNSLSEMACTAEMIFFYEEIFVEKMEQIQIYEGILKEILYREKYCLNREDISRLHLFLGTLDEDIFKMFQHIIQEAIAEAERTNENLVCTIPYRTVFRMGQQLSINVGIHIMPWKKEVRIEQWRMEFI